MLTDEYFVFCTMQGETIIVPDVQYSASGIDRQLMG